MIQKRKKDKNKGVGCASPLRPLPRFASAVAPLAQLMHKG